MDPVSFSQSIGIRIRKTVTVKGELTKKLSFQVPLPSTSIVRFSTDFVYGAQNHDHLNSRKSICKSQKNEKNWLKYVLILGFKVQNCFITSLWN